MTSRISPELPDGIPAPETVAMYLYDNKQRKLSLQTQMNLQQDRETVTEMAAATRNAAMEHFELDVPTYREQRPEALAAVTGQVLKECKGIRKYKDGWPVSRYIRIYLKNYHPKAKKGRRSKASRAASIKKATTSRLRPGPGRHSAGYRSEREASVEEEPHRELGRHEDTKRNDTSVVSSDIPTQAGPSRPNAFTPEADSPNPVPSFLRSLRIPPRDVVLMTALLKDMGVEDQEYLEILAAMGTRNRWLVELQDEGALSPIQVRLLKEGLDRLGKSMG